MKFLDDKKDINGNIHINGNLYITDTCDPTQLSDEGIMIFVKDCIFNSNKKDIILMDNDVFIENLFDKLKVKNIVLN